MNIQPTNPPPPPQLNVLVSLRNKVWYLYGKTLCINRSRIKKYRKLQHTIGNNTKINFHNVKMKCWTNDSPTTYNQ